MSPLPGSHSQWGRPLTFHPNSSSKGHSLPCCAAGPSLPTRRYTPGAGLAVLKGLSLTFHFDIDSKGSASRADAIGGCLGLPVGVGHKCSLQVGSSRQPSGLGAATMVQHLWKQTGARLNYMSSLHSAKLWACRTACGLISSSALQGLGSKRVSTCMQAAGRSQGAEALLRRRHAPGMAQRLCNSRTRACAFAAKPHRASPSTQPHSGLQQPTCCMQSCTAAFKLAALPPRRRWLRAAPVRPTTANCAALPLLAGQRLPFCAAACHSLQQGRRPQASERA